MSSLCWVWMGQLAAPLSYSDLASKLLGSSIAYMASDRPTTGVSHPFFLKRSTMARFISIVHTPPRSARLSLMLTHQSRGVLTFKKTVWTENEKLVLKAPWNETGSRKRFVFYTGRRLEQTASSTPTRRVNGIIRYTYWSTIVYTFIVCSSQDFHLVKRLEKPKRADSGTAPPTFRTK